MNIKEFKNPGKMYRPAPFWSWNDTLDPDELKRQIRELADKGYGGYFMHSRAGLVTGYLTKEWMDAIRTCAETAAETDTCAWLYDEDRWPSGFAGGLFTSNVEYRSRALVLLKKQEITENDTILEEVKQGEETTYICKRIAPMGHHRFSGTSYADLMSPAAVKAFIDCTHEQYKKECGQYFTKEIPGIFTDEPCYLYHTDYSMPVVPWSDYLPDYFINLKGYSIEKHLTELFYNINDYRKVRFDFYDSVTRLFRDSFTKQYYSWCEDNNMIMTGHFMSEDTMTGQTMWIGAAMPQYEFMHWPGIDKLSRHLKQVVTTKQLTSCTDQFGRERAFSEMFGCIGQQSSFFHRKWIADWQAVLGINFVNSHLSHYSMRGERKRDYPANLFYQQPWWDGERNFSDYLSRMSYITAQGKRNVDILVIHPISSVWCNYTPFNKYNLDIESSIYEKGLTDIAEQLTAMKLDFHFGDEIIMENHASVKDGKLVIGQHAYSTVIIPPACTLRSNTFKLLEDFAASAGSEKLIVVKPGPDRIDGVITDIPWPTGVSKANTVRQAVTLANNFYPEKIKVMDALTGENARKAFCQERISKEGRYIFIINTDETRELQANISIPGNENPLILDLMTGNTYTMPGCISNGRWGCKIKFYPAGSLMLFFPSEKIAADTMSFKADALPPYLDSGIELGKPDTIVKTNLLSPAETELSEYNVLPLNDVTLFMDGSLVAENKPLSAVWHNLYYTAPDGTPFKAEYSFEVISLPQGEIYAAIEVAENLDLISLNGIRVQPRKVNGEQGALDTFKSWKDINFTLVPLTGALSTGTNRLILEGHKVNNINKPNSHIPVSDYKNHRPTEVEAVYILGNFSVINEDNTRFMIDGVNKKPKPIDLTSSGYPFYSGNVVYRNSFIYSNKSGRVLLKVNNVRAACVKLYINDNYLGIKYWAPYIFDITDYLSEGTNEIKLEASTTLFNLMGPNRIDGILNSEAVSPRTFIDSSRYTEKYTLLPFGIGSISITELR